MPHTTRLKIKIFALKLASGLQLVPTWDPVLTPNSVRSRDAPSWNQCVESVCPKGQLGSKNVEHTDDTIFT